MKELNRQRYQDLEGIEKNEDPGLKRAFQFDQETVDPALRKAENIRLPKEGFRVSGDAVFFTLQGEGLTQGIPTVFLRLHLCNLKCGFCDAWYTWNAKTPEFWTESKAWSIDETAQRVEDVWGVENPRIKKTLVITGGEPLLQKAQIDKLIEKLGVDWRVEIETNGTIMPTERQLAEAQFNCSPKLENSLNVKQARIKPEVLLALNGANTTFKFVVMTNEDIDEIERDYIDGVGIDPEKVLLMPQGVSAEEVDNNMKRVVEYAKERGYRLMGRLQVQAWDGARRGV